MAVGSTKKIIPEREDARRAGEGLSGLADRVLAAVDRTQAYYRREQHPEGYWWYELESNASITAQYLMLLHFLGIHDEPKDRKIARCLLNHQGADGTWPIYPGGPGDLSTTVEAYFALRLAGFKSNEPSLVRSRDFVLSRGGLDSCKLFTKVFLALFGQFDWRMVPSIPVEMILLPLWFPLNMYNFSSWARATLIPMSIVRDLKPGRSIPAEAQVEEELRPDMLENVPLRDKVLLLSWRRLFLALDWIAETMDRTSLRLFRPKAMKKAREWILSHQEPSGDWAGIEAAMVHSIIALSTLGHTVSSEPIRTGLEALRRFEVEDDDGLRLQASISPVWDTALTSLALTRSGITPEDPLLARSSEWLASRQIMKKGDWSIKRPRLEPGGWAFEFDNSWYPDVDDTAVTLMFLQKRRGQGGAHEEGLKKGFGWLLGMQGKDGGWGAFDTDNNRDVFNQIPFSDLQATVDPSTADITGRAIEALGMEGYSVAHERVRAAVRFLGRIQEPDGSWAGRWGVNYLYGTWSVLMGLRSIGEDMSAPYVRKAVECIKGHQNADGGWGESFKSYLDVSHKMCGRSVPSQTAWAIMALIAAGDGNDVEALRGVEFLLRKQKPDGTWDEEEFTGTGIPKHFAMRYHNYRNCFPLMALGMFSDR
jgi:squalene-hopene/tetraprenyl-beta-curcumene cyclase